MKKTLLLLFFLLSFHLKAQIKIHGTVADANDKLFGAVVLLKNTNFVSVTDQSGAFQL